MAPFIERFRNDIMGIFWLAMGLFLGLSLYSFNPADPSFNSTGYSTVVQNYCGFFGSFASDLLFQSLGVTAWLFVFAAFRLSYGCLRGQEVSLRAIQMVWVALLLVVGSSLLSLYLPEKTFYTGQITIGGVAGHLIAEGLVSVLNRPGVGVILWSTLVVLMLFYTDKTLKEFIQIPLEWFQSFKERTRSMDRERLKRLLQRCVPPMGSWRKASTAESGEEFGERPSISAKKFLALPEREEEKVQFVDELDENVDNSVELGDANAENSTENAEEGGGLVGRTLKIFSRSTDDDEGEEIPTKKRKVKLAAKVQRKIENWELPKLEMLEDPPLNRVRVDEAEIQMKAELLVDKLAQFSVKGSIVGAKTGPAVTMFEFKPNADVKISKITELADDLSLALSAESVRIIAPIPGRNVVGIETSNSQRETVYLKDTVAGKKFWDSEMKLPVPLGQQADGAPKVVDLRKMPHLLVAGTTGSGKSVFVVSTLTGLLFKHSPKTLKLILIDPKQVDLAAFGKVPHLIMPPIREAKKAVGALRWAINEMEKRYRSMARFGARGIEGFNEKVSKLNNAEIEKHENMNEELVEINMNEQYYYTPQPYMVIVVEEFGDLMAVDKGNVEQSVVRLAQMARACGIHLILAMQSPRKDVVTGLIKTNIPGRISFKVASKMDSRIILDDSGAERLLARGDMLFLAPGVAKPERHHGPWLSEPEIDGVVDFWSDQGEPEYDELAMRALDGSGGGFDLPGSAGGGDEEYDERYDEVLAWVSTQKGVSASLLQRKFRLGYPRAARMIELFENEGVVGPANGSKPREVLVRSYAES